MVKFIMVFPAILRLIRISLSVACFAGVSFFVAACEETDTGRRPPAATPTRPASNTPPGFQQPNMNSPTVVSTAPANPNQGVGCVGDAELVPNEPGLRECCVKLGAGNACNQSACWANGLIAKIKSQMQPGGKCAN